MKSKLIGGLKKIFLPKKKKRESKNVSEIGEIFTLKRLHYKKKVLRPRFKVEKCGLTMNYNPIGRNIIVNLLKPSV